MKKNSISKTCSRCKKEQSISRFYKNRTASDGYDHYCIDCNNKRMHKYYHTEKGKAAIKRGRSSEKSKAAIKRASRKYSERKRKEKNAK